MSVMSSKKEEKRANAQQEEANDIEETGDAYGSEEKTGENDSLEIELEDTFLPDEMGESLEEDEDSDEKEESEPNNDSEKEEESVQNNEDSEEEENSDSSESEMEEEFSGISVQKRFRFLPDEMEESEEEDEESECES
ncbi:uncharacterized protein [Palaemon carinicauda]|uniref:uncharacterized protein n=1 Tax=Palaemon carinicauda TaxID=392227 RepID=UPI0035B6143A